MPLLPEYEKFTANRRNYLKIFFSKEITNTEIALAIRAIAHHERIDEYDYTIIYRTKNGNWYGWGMLTKRAVTEGFRFWQEAMKATREINDCKPQKQPL